MKDSGRCPKCQATDVIRVPGTSYNLSLTRPHAIPVGWSSFVAVTRFICGKCGYVEEWVEDAAALQTLKKKYGSYHPESGDSDRGGK